MLATLLLVVVTFIKGFQTDENPWYIAVETILNLVIVADFLCRVRLVGIKRFFGNESQGRLWNWMDAGVVLGSLIMFLVIISTHSATNTSNSGNNQDDSRNYFEDLSEIVLLLIWAFFQLLRVIFIAKRQRLAQQSAKTLIDFTHNIIVVDSEPAAATQHNN